MDAHDWDARYEGAELVWSAGPNAFVVEHLAGLAPGRAVDVACGEGRNTLWLAEQGWDATGIDFSAVAVDKARRIAAHRGLDVEFLVGDVTDPELLDGEFDLVLIAYLHLGHALDDVLTSLAAHLAPDSRLVVLGHHIDNLERGYGGPPDRAVLHDPAHLASMAAEVGLVVDQAGEVARTVATDDGERTAVDSLVIARRPA